MKHIVMIEDNEGDLLIAQELFSGIDEQIKLENLSDGKIAIEHFLMIIQDDLSVPDLVILDINLPRRNGHEVLEFIRAEPKFDEMPVVVLSTSSYFLDKERALLNKANDYITKSSDLDELESDLRNICVRWLS